MNQFKKNVKSLLTFRWQPGQDTLIAFITALLMIPLYFVGTHIQNVAVTTIVFILLGNVLLNVLFPVFYILRVRGEGLADVGITARKWWIAAIISIAISAVSWLGLQRIIAQTPGVDPVPQILYNGLILWEPFFVFGWLQLRFERAFGILPGILLAGVAMGAYHIGTFPLSGILTMALFGLSFAAVFRVTRNLLSMWPLTWAICSSIGSLQGGLLFSWSTVFIYTAVLAVQILGIIGIAMLARKHHHAEVQL